MGGDQRRNHRKNRRCKSQNGCRIDSKRWGSHCYSESLWGINNEIRAANPKVERLKDRVTSKTLELSSLNVVKYKQFDVSIKERKCPGNRLVIEQSGVVMF